jgi:hypothetical protein
MVNHARMIALALGIGACGSSSGSGPSIDDFETQGANAVCAYEVRCGYFIDEATCRANQLFENSVELTTIADVKSGAIKYDSGAAADCLAEDSAATCEYAGFRVASSCSSVFSGTKTAGATCEIDDECVANTTCVALQRSCDRFLSCCPGTCVPRAQVGGACSIAACSADASCADTTMKCTALGSLGGTCYAIDGCVDPLICNIDNATHTGTCVMPAADGGTCDPAVSVPCAVGGQFCNATTLKCTPLPSSGGSCDVSSGCRNGGLCDPTTHLCLPARLAGDACNESMNMFCDPSGLVCVNSVCKLETASTCSTARSAVAPKQITRGDLFRRPYFAR